MIICPNCQQSLPDDAKFCGNCAAAVGNASGVKGRDSFVGKSINNKYLVKSRIASGGMGEIYLAIQKGVQQEVAIKKLRPEYYRDGEIVKRFIDEARSYAKITHPNAVKLHDLLNVNGQLCIIMEYVNGKTLTHYIDSGYVFSIRQIIDISLQLSDALGTVHRAGIIHRDLKTENVMLLETVTGRFSVKILDFGIAKFMDRTKDRSTKEGVIVGTPEFMSPEQCYGETVDLRTDIYGFGILMYVMICNRLPFEASTYLAVLKMQVEAPVPEPGRPDGSDLPGDLVAIVKKCLMKHPEDRYGSFEEVIADLTAVQEGGRVSIASAPATPGRDPGSGEDDSDTYEESDEIRDDELDSGEFDERFSRSSSYIGNIDVSEDNALEPEFSLDGDEDEGDGLVLGSFSDLPAVTASAPHRRGHGGAVAVVFIVLIVLAGAGFVFAARGGAIDLSASGVPGWLLPQDADPPATPDLDVAVSPSAGNGEKPVEIGMQAGGVNPPAAPVLAAPAEPDPVPPSTAMTRQVFVRGILQAAMDKSGELLNSGELDAAEGLLAYLNTNRSDLDESGAALFQDLSARQTRFREILASANRTRNGAREGRSCAPIAELIRTIPGDASGMIEKVEKIERSCQNNLSAVPSSL